MGNCAGVPKKAGTEPAKVGAALNSAIPNTSTAPAPATTTFAGGKALANTVSAESKPLNAANNINQNTGINSTVNVNGSSLNSAVVGGYNSGLGGASSNSVATDLNFKPPAAKIPVSPAPPAPTVPPALVKDKDGFTYAVPSLPVNEAELARIPEQVISGKTGEFMPKATSVMDIVKQPIARIIDQVPSEYSSNFSLSTKPINLRVEAV